jgi:hypothetical protein
MQQRRNTAAGTTVQEPIGIVISTGWPSEPAPRFQAFVWGPAPEELSEVLLEVAPAR